MLIYYNGFFQNRSGQSSGSLLVMGKLRNTGHFIRCGGYDYFMELNRIQSMVARFVLQFPKSVALAAGYIDAGMKPMQARIMQRTCLFVWKMMNSSNPLLSNVLGAVRQDCMKYRTQRCQAIWRRQGQHVSIGENLFFRRHCLTALWRKCS